jgi:6-pyruvoyltetrahydropterin/6-carboxytetrahydropterin synthase
MISISKSYDFDAAHQLDLDTCTVEENNHLFGKCNNLHGHTYKLTVEVSGLIDDTTGMVLNYFTLDELVKPFVERRLDHTFLNASFPGMLTTAENLVMAIGEELSFKLPHNVKLQSVMLQETPKTMAKWTSDK